MYNQCAEAGPQKKLPHKMSTMTAAGTQIHQHLFHIRSLCEVCIRMKPAEFIKEIIKCRNEISVVK